VTIRSHLRGCADQRSLLPLSKAIRHTARSLELEYLLHEQQQSSLHKVLPHSNRKHTPGVKRDHQFFIGVYCPGRDAAAGSADARSAGNIGLRIEFEA
jgi:hypothetical protein